MSWKRSFSFTGRATRLFCSISILRRHAAYPTRTAAFFCSFSEQDTSYWSDQLYTELSTTLDGHRAVLDAGINGWLKRCAGQPVSPTLLLDQEIQKLNALPDKLGLLHLLRALCL